METEIKTNIKSRTENSGFGYWNEETEEFIRIDALNTSEVAQRLNVSVEFIEGLLATFEELRDYVIGDLVDTWKRLDELEKRVAELEKYN